MDCIGSFNSFLMLITVSPQWELWFFSLNGSSQCDSEGGNFLKQETELIIVSLTNYRVC